MAKEMEKQLDRDTLLEAAEAGDTASVGQILESQVSAHLAAEAIQRAVFAGRSEVLDQIQHWSMRRWGKPLLNDAAVLDLVLSAQLIEGGIESSLDERLAHLLSNLESQGTSAGREVSFQLAEGLAEAEGLVGSDPSNRDALSDPTSGLTVLSAQLDLPLGDSNDGIEYFVARMFGTFPQWSIVAFETSAEDVAPRLAEYLGVERWLPKAEKQPVQTAENEFFLLQLHGHDWSLLLTVSLPQAPHLLGDFAADSSARLGVRTVAFCYEETGGSSIAQVFENGRRQKGARSRRGWQSLFRRLGLFIPFFGIHTAQGRTELVLEGIQRSKVAALHFFG